MKLYIWKQGYRPFIMGGNVNYVKTIKAESEERFVIRTFLFHVVKDTTGKVWAVEGKSKGVVAGPQANVKDLKEEIKINFKDTALSELRKQVQGGLEWYAKHDKVEVTKKEFWN